MPFLSKTFGAHRTWVRLDTGMNSHVISQVRPLWEYFYAVCALVSIFQNLLPFGLICTQYRYSGFFVINDVVMVALRLVWVVISFGLGLGHILGNWCIAFGLGFLVGDAANFLFFLNLIWARTASKVVCFLNIASIPIYRLNHLHLLQYISADINLVWNQIRQLFLCNLVLIGVFGIVSSFKVGKFVNKHVIRILDGAQLQFKFSVHF